MRGRSPIFWILLMLVVGGIGLALDKGFTDDTPPNDEPPIASLGLLLFLLCGAAFAALCARALLRLARGSAGVAVSPAVTDRPLGAAIILALVGFRSPRSGTGRMPPTASRPSSWCSRSRARSRWSCWR